MSRSKPQKWTGAVFFWLTYPLAYVYLQLGSRTRVLIIAGNEVLLVKGWLGLDEWGLPGGGVHRGELPSTGALREVREETGITLADDQLKLLYKAEARTRGFRFNYTCFYVQLATKPTCKPSAEIAELTWLPLKDVTAANVTSDTYQAVQTWLQHENLL